MTEAANASKRHPRSADRWREAAREMNASLSPAQLDRLAERLRREYFAALGRRGAAARAAAKVAPMARDAADRAA